MTTTSFNLYTVKEIIDRAFGKEHKNVVNFKLIQTVLYLMARHLRILERRVQLNLDRASLEEVPSTLTVTEIKVHAHVPKKKVRPIKKVLEVLAEPGEPPNSRKEEIRRKKYVKDKADSDKKSRDKSDKTTDDNTGSANVDRKASDEKIGKPVTKKASIETLFPGKIVSQEASDERIRTGKAVTEKASTEKIYKGKGADKAKSNKIKGQKAAEKSAFENKPVTGELDKTKRANSYVETVKTPTPMASLDSTEIKYEKLLIVERLPSREASKMSSQERTSQISVVTQTQFKTLVDTVAELKAQIEPIATPAFPENVQLMQDLRRGASLTEAMAALQLAARVEALEGAIEKMMAIMTDIIKKNPQIREATSHETKETQFGKDVVILHAVTATTFGMKTPEADEMSVEIPITQPQPQVYYEDKNTEKRDQGKYITYDILENALESMYNEFFKAVSTCTARSNTNSEKAIKLATNLEEAIQTTLTLDTRMQDLETTVVEYAEQINNLDTGLSAQMTLYQEQLSQMQHDLDSGLENMTEALAAQGGDSEALRDLNDHFLSLQNNIDVALSLEKNLQDIQDSMGLDIDSLRGEIEIFREIKCDRDEVADALRDKASIKDLNGLVNISQFEAVHGEIQKNILAAYNKFDAQEFVWQKAIDELTKDLSNRAELSQLEALSNDVQQNLDNMKGRIDGLLDILGEPKTAAITRRIFREAACLSCGTPAHMDLEEPGITPAYSPVRLPQIGSESSSKPAEDGDHRVCYPGMPIPHSKDPRARYCSRYCGGSHTVQSTQAHLAPSLAVRREMRESAIGIGSDGRSYMLDEQIIRKPCLPCKVAKQIPQISSVEEFPETMAGDTAEGPCPCCLQKRTAPVRKLYRSFEQDSRLDMSSLTDPLDLQPQDIDQISSTPPVMFNYD